MTDRPVAKLSMYVFHNASRQGRYATIEAQSVDGAAGQTLASCPTESACVAPCAGGSLAIVPRGEAIEVITDRFVLGCDGLDLGTGAPIPVRYTLTRADGALCGGP
ncbi:MAG: hypothetical protein AAF914_02530 [Pseudomonadota bacterium]